MRRWASLWSAAALVVVASCGSGVNALPVIATAQESIGVGTQRVLVGLTDLDGGESLASEDLAVTATLRDRIGSPLGEYEGEFVWMVPDVRGLYVFEMDFPGPGTFQVTLENDDLGEMGPVGIMASEDPPMVGLGDSAPLSETRTTTDHDLGDITTDPDPNPSFYETTVADAISEGPSVIVFATPAWCTSQTCGPLLDQVKALAPGFPDLNFVHVEVYDNIHASSYDDLVTVPAVQEWGLPSEPWVFVVDAEGIVTRAFEGVASDGELAASFEFVAP